MPDIFLSYAEEDRETARVLVSLLEPLGWSVWWDRRIPAGQTWRKVLDSALADMKCMLVLWSTHSLSSEWVIEEAEEGKSLGKLVPILLEPIRPSRGFRVIQALDFARWDRSSGSHCFQALVQDLRAMIGPGTPVKVSGRSAAPAPPPNPEVAGPRLSSAPSRLPRNSIEAEPKA